MDVAPRATQLAFDFGPGEPVAEVETVDDLAERLIAGGIVANDYLLRINRSLQNPDPALAPSRLYRFPLEFVDRDRLDAGARSRLLLNHPRLVDLPFVRRVATVTAVEPEWDPHDEFGRERNVPRWWHAVDLMTEADWRHLVATRHLTEDACITSAIVFALETPAHYGRGCRSDRINVETARIFLATLDAEEPADRSDALLCGDGIDPSHIVEKHHRTGKTLRDCWTINVRATGAAGSWLVVHGIEDGWFTRDRSGHLQMTPAGRARRGSLSMTAKETDQ